MPKSSSTPDKVSFSFSASWNSARHTNGFDLIKEIKDIGFDTVELNFALTKKMVDDIVSLVDSAEIKVSSLHNICPLPDGVEPKAASPDYYSLASPDNGERSSAIAVTKNTIFYAKRLGAKAVILHIGKVEMKDRLKKLALSADDKKKFNMVKEEMMKERNQKRGPYLASVMKSLKELVPYAKEMGVMLGIENRYYYREIPLIEELEDIFKNFKINDLYYWHDVGHAEVFERLKLARHRDYLDKFSNRLLGVHLHDIIGLIDDHKPPGSGTFDFNAVKPYIRKDTIKVIEAHQPATADGIRQSIKYLTKIFKGA